MKIRKARDWEWERGMVNAGARLYPYQVGLGISISWWPCLKRPQISLHIVPFKLWVGISGERLKGKGKKNGA